MLRTIIMLYLQNSSNFSIICYMIYVYIHINNSTNRSILFIHIHNHYSIRALPVSNSHSILPSVRTPHTGKSWANLSRFIAVFTASALSSPTSTTRIFLALLKTGSVIVTEAGDFYIHICTNIH